MNVAKSLSETPKPAESGDAQATRVSDEVAEHPYWATLVTVGMIHGDASLFSHGR